MVWLRPTNIGQVISMCSSGISTAQVLSQKAAHTVTSLEVGVMDRLL